MGLQPHCTPFQWVSGVMPSALHCRTGTRREFDPRAVRIPSLMQLPWGWPWIPHAHSRTPSRLGRGGDPATLLPLPDTHPHRGPYLPLMLHSSLPKSLWAWQDAPKLHLLQMDCIRGRTKHWRVFKEKSQWQPYGEVSSPQHSTVTQLVAPVPLWRWLWWEPISRSCPEKNNSILPKHSILLQNLALFQLKIKK